MSTLVSTLRKARTSDAQTIHEIIQQYADQRLMLPRPLMQIYEHIRDYIVVEQDGRVVGCAALHCFWEDLAEIRALAVAPDCAGAGLGKELVLQLMDEARSMRIAQVFAFTYIPQFFEKFGFQTVPHSSLPLKVWKDCVSCPFFNNCNEIAMIKQL